MSGPDLRGRRDFPLLAVIDMQRFFDVGGIWSLPDFGRLIAPIGRLVESYSERAIFTRFIIPAAPDGSWADYYQAWPQAHAPEAACQEDLVQPWAGQGRETLDKTTFSKWGPDLAEMLGPGRQLSVCGVSTDCCVLATVLAAVDGGARVCVIADACAGITPEAHQQALTLMAGLAPQVTISRVDDELKRLTITLF